jgi:hypothetical protein
MEVEEEAGSRSSVQESWPSHPNLWTPLMWNRSANHLNCSQTFSTNKLETFSYFRCYRRPPSGLVYNVTEYNMYLDKPVFAHYVFK